MTKPLSEQDHDEECVWNAISTIHHVAQNDHKAVTFEEALAQLRQELLGQQSQKEYPSGVFLQGVKTAAIRKLTGSTPAVETCIVWLRNTGQFNEKELRRIRRIRLFKEDPSGLVSINEKMISLGVATTLLGLVCLAAGVWIGWIVFGTKGDIQNIANSFALGTIMGSLTSFILDRSFRLHKMREKIGAFAPWFVNFSRQSRGFRQVDDQSSATT